MAFRTSFLIGEECDRCREIITDGSPGIRFEQQTRTDRNVIFIHIKCLQRELCKLPQIGIAQITWHIGDPTP